MKKRWLSLISITGITPVVLAVSCSSNKVTKYETLIYDLSSQKKTALVIKKYEPTKIDDLEVIDKSTNKSVGVNYQLSKIENGNTTLILNEYHQENSIYQIINKSDQNFTVDVTSKKTFNAYDFNQDKWYFFDLVKDMSLNKIPTIIESRGASLLMQQSFFISLVNYYQNKDKTIDNNFSILIPQEEAWKQNRFNQEALISKNIWNGQKDLDLVTPENRENFNIIENSELYSGPEPYIKNFEKVIENFGINTKFDFVVPDVDFKNWISELEKNNNFNRLSVILKHVNRIVVTSDGSIHTNTVVPYLDSKLRNFKPRAREEVIQILEDYQSGKTNKLSTRDLFDILLLDNYEATNPNSNFHFISFINYDGNIKNSIDISDEQMWNETAFSTNFVEYASLIENEQYKSDYLDTFSKVFLGLDQKLENIIINGLGSYDPRKRNAVFIGSSLFTPILRENESISIENFSRLQNFENVRREVQKTMDEFLKKFPPSEYNIMFKLHPVFAQQVEGSIINNEIAKNYIKLITNNQIEDPIIINAKIPLETLIANDYYQYINPEANINLDSIFFKENQTYKAHEWTTFFGLQATTTTIHTTRLFYQSAFNLTKEEVANLIPFSNFPVPVYFPVVSRVEDDILRNHYDNNLERIKLIYSYYCPSIINNDEELYPYDSIVLNFDSETNVLP